jgi:DinB superfamily
MDVTKLSHTIDIWIDALQNCDPGYLLEKPDGESWSLGQVFMHLLNETNYYIEQIECCLAHGENESGQMAESAELMFARNELPDEKIKGDPQSTDKIIQPESKAGLLQQMLALKTQLISLCKSINDGNSKGKAAHPGLGYFNADEWLRFADMHLRHHLRQKNRIEEALKPNPKIIQQ